jgi:hypothetical protein
VIVSIVAFKMKNERIPRPPSQDKSMKLRSLICPLSTKRDAENGAFPTAEDDGSFPVCATSQHDGTKSRPQKKPVVVSTPPNRSSTSSKKKMLRRPFKVRVSIGDCSNQGGGGGGRESGTCDKGGEQGTVKLLQDTDDENDEMPLLGGDPISKEWSLRGWIPGSGMLSDTEPC